MIATPVIEIENMLTLQLEKDIKLNLFFNELEKNAIDIILIGGSIRDAVNGNYNPRDIDLILKCSDNDKINCIIQHNNIKHSQNQFKRYKLAFQNITVDMWLLSNHYPFQKNLYAPKVENIKETTFINYDSLVYDKRNQTLYKDYYDICTQNKLIDLIGTEKSIRENPTPYTNILKILKIKYQTNYDLSDNILRYISDYTNFCQDNSINFYNKLRYEYIRHYCKECDDLFFSFMKKTLDDILNNRPL